MENISITCGICSKHFSSRKALGGHMRSHLVILPVPPKPETKNQAPDNSADLIQRPIQSASSLKRNFSALANSNIKKESGSYAYPNNPTRKRSECRRKHTAAADVKAELKQMSSIAETLEAEKAAWSLVKLSTDEWPESKKMTTQNMKETTKMEAKARFKCDSCGKMFRSHQALGGHKSSHNKRKNLSQEGGYSEDDKSGNNGDAVDQKVFQCSYCSRVFKSAQALGGHKKVHSSNVMATNADSNANELQGVLALPVNLNFPTPTEDKKVSNTQIESTVQ